MIYTKNNIICLDNNESISFDKIKLLCNEHFLEKFKIEKIVYKKLTNYLIFEISNTKADNFCLPIPTNNKNIFLINLLKTLNKLYKILILFKKYKINFFTNKVIFANIEEEACGIIGHFYDTYLGDENIYANFTCENFDNIYQRIKYNSYKQNETKISTLDNKLYISSMDIDEVLYYPNNFTYNFDFKSKNIFIYISTYIDFIKKSNNEIYVSWNTPQQLLSKFFENFMTFINIREFIINDEFHLLKYL